MQAKSPGIPVDAPVNIQCADDTLYLAEIGSPPGLRVALGPRPAGQPDMWLGHASLADVAMVQGTRTGGAPVHVRVRVPMVFIGVQPWDS